MIKKLLLGGAIGLVVLIIVAVLVVGFFLGDIVKKGMETVGPEMMQVSVSVHTVNVSLMTGSASIQDFVIGNPKGYQAPQAISVGSTAVGVNPLSIFSDKIVVRTLHVEAPEITFEGNPLTGNNLSQILQNVNTFTKSSGPAATNTTARTSPKPGRKIEVDDFLITGAKVNFNDNTLMLPDIHLNDLGKGNAGITAADLTQQMLNALTSAIIKTVVVNELGKNAGEVGKDLGKMLGSGGSSRTNLTKGLGGLFKQLTN